MKTRTVRGSELRVGDTIEVWWAPRRDTIVGLGRYAGPLEYLFPAGAQIATFALLSTGMTIDNDDVYELVARGAP